MNEAETERECADSLYRVSSLLAGAHDTDEVLNLIVNEAARLLGANGAYMRLSEGDLLVPSAFTESLIGYVSDNTKAQPTLVVEEGTRGYTGAGYVMATKNPTVRDDATKDEGVRPEIRLIIKQHGFHSVAMVPMVANDQSIGVLSVMDKRIRHFTEDEVSLLTAYADQASLALEKARLLSEAEARERQATHLYEVTTQLASNHDLDSVLDLITQQAAKLMGGKSGLIMRFDEDRGGLIITTMYNLPPALEGILIKLGEGNSGRAYQERRLAWSNGAVGDGRYSDAETGDFVGNQFADWGQVGVVAAPILIQDEVYGVLNVIFDQHCECSPTMISNWSRIWTTAPPWPSTMPGSSARPSRHGTKPPSYTK